MLTENLNNNYLVKNRIISGAWSKDLSTILYSSYLELQKIYLEVYFEAIKSPCVRRVYASSLFTFDPTTPRHYAHNRRVTTCCDTECIRDVMKIQHGISTDLGAEVHAEQSLLVSNWDRSSKYYIFIAGWNKAGPLYGLESWPCYSCARIIKEAGLKRVWVPDKEDEFSGYDIDYILDEYNRRNDVSFGNA